LEIYEWKESDKKNKVKTNLENFDFEEIVESALVATDLNKFVEDIREYFNSHEYVLNEKRKLFVNYL